MNFTKVLKENKIILNELRINRLVDHYKKGRFKDTSQDVSSLIGTLTDEKDNPLTYVQAIELIKKYGYQEIPKDLDNILKTGTQNYQINTQAAELEKTNKIEKRKKMKGGSIATSRNYA